jgi:hypothetical protein
MMITKILVGAFLLFWMNGAMAKPLEPAVKKEFAELTGSSCLTNQAKRPDNAQLNVGKLQDYCVCYGREFAEILTVEVYEAIDKSDTFPPEAEKLVAKAEAKCGTEINKKKY